MQPTNDNHLSGGLQYVVKHNDNDSSSSRSSRMFNRECKGNGGERKSDKITNAFSISNRAKMCDGEIIIKS